MSCSCCFALSSCHPFHSASSHVSHYHVIISFLITHHQHLSSYQLGSFLSLLRQVMDNSRVSAYLDMASCLLLLCLACAQQPHLFVYSRTYSLLPTLYFGFPCSKFLHGMHIAHAPGRRGGGGGTSAASLPGQLHHLWEEGERRRGREKKEELTSPA